MRDVRGLALLKESFTPWQITNHGESTGLFTGYY